MSWKVKTLKEKTGINSITCDGKNESNTKVTSGIYIYVAEGSDGKSTGKFVVR